MSQISVIQSLVDQQVYNTAEAESFELNFKARFSFVKFDANRVKFMKSGQLDFYKGSELVASVPESILEAVFGFKTRNDKSIMIYHIVF
jgi:hypothetical protein